MPDLPACVMRKTRYALLDGMHWIMVTHVAAAIMIIVIPATALRRPRRFNGTRKAEIPENEICK